MTEPRDNRLSTAPPSRLLLTAGDLAEILNVSKNHVLKMHTVGRLGPRPVRLGRAVRWSRNEVEKWVTAGCPPRNKWQVERELSKP